MHSVMQVFDIIRLGMFCHKGLSLLTNGNKYLLSNIIFKWFKKKLENILASKRQDFAICMPDFGIQYT